MNEKLTGILIGVFVTIGMFSLLGVTTAHMDDVITGNSYDGMMDGMMSNTHGGMSHMHDINDEHQHTGMTAEEMDQDGDGLCDMHGMPVEDCLKMMGSGSMIGCHMMI
jgi:hypothetical protein